MTIYSAFSHEKWWFSIVMLNYQRVWINIYNFRGWTSGNRWGNGEDLEGFAGAGLFESVCAEEERWTSSRCSDGMGALGTLVIFMTNEHEGWNKQGEWTSFAIGKSKTMWIEFQVPYLRFPIEFKVPYVLVVPHKIFPQAKEIWLSLR